MPRLAIVLLPLLLTACPSEVPMTPYSPLELKTKEPAASLYNAAIRTLVKRGFGFAQRDPGAYAMETEYVATGGRGGYKYAWRVITARGVVSIFCSCLYWQYFEEKSSPKPCGANRPTGLIREQEEIANEILRDAQQDTH